ncbi:MAG TPA: response regulator transcription factor, partial [Cytophagaceae bacterium]|nr:response regulator transcription factor [Cytophagaceae bacterium]
FRNGVKSLLENEEGIEIIGEANDGEEALEKVRALAPDVLMVDISMPKMSGIETVEILNKEFKHTKALILSMHNNDDYILKSVECGAHGYLLKDTSKEEMLKALHAVAAGEKYFAGTVSNTIVNGYLNKIHTKESDDKSDKAKISRQEKAILRFIVEGLSSREIAEKLDLSGRTVDNHRANMMKKMNVRNAAELVRLAIELKLT